MSSLQFSWNNQKGYGLTLLFFGWALILQLPAFYHIFLVIQVPATANDWLIFLGTIILVTVILGSFLATMFENLFDPFDQTLVNAHTIVLVSFLVFYFFYVLSVPFLIALEPFLGLPTEVPLFGWGAYIISLVSGLLGVAILWYASELLKTRN